MSSQKFYFFLISALLTTMTLLSNTENDQPCVQFIDIAAGDGAGITYRRTASARNAIFDAIKAESQYVVPQDIFRSPLKPRGIPGVALIDFDGDGDLDMYVTNGPGSPNSLYANQLMETGSLRFIDVAAAAGVEATAQDSAGVCFGDLDNDGDSDLYVLGTAVPNILFRNNGDGTFTDITAESGTAAGSLNANSASMGDVNGDGLLDIYIGNFATYDDQRVIFVEIFGLNEHNQLFLNKGNLVFEEVAASSGLRDYAGLPAENVGAALPTHAVGMVDYDLDGDIDIFSADDQAAITPALFGGTDRGYARVLQNDGTGSFTDKTLELGTDFPPGAWMGLSFGDFNGDGHMDFFISNFGDYGTLFFVPQVPFTNAASSRWFFQQDDGTFVTPDDLGQSVTLPFGWGTSARDFDNDGDTDILSHGGLDAGPFVDATNPGVLLDNLGNGEFRYAEEAFALSTDHNLRTVHGSAVGDLDRDGFTDIVSVSNFDISPDAPLKLQPAFGGPLDSKAFILETFAPTETPGIYVYDTSLPPLLNGTLSVEINQRNANRSVTIGVKGSIGITDGGSVNRDGIGAVLICKAYPGAQTMQPVIGGSSYASQDSLDIVFGLGSSQRARIEVLWPGGVRNHLTVWHGEHIVLPEIPVNFGDRSIPYQEYRQRITKALDDLIENGLLDKQLRARFLVEAILAYYQAR